MRGSVRRTERTGPTTSGTCDWNIARKRVPSPSTTSSQTMSAPSMPVCGRARLLSLSILIDTSGRPSAAPPGSGGRVRGATGGAFVVVLVDEDEAPFGGEAFDPDPPHAATRTTTP